MINDYKVVIFYLWVDAPIRSTVVLDRKLIVLQRINEFTTLVPKEHDCFSRLILCYAFGH